MNNGNVTGNFSDDMRKYVVKVPPLLTTVEGRTVTLPAVVFEFDTGSSATPADVASALQSYVGKYSSTQAGHAPYLCKWLRRNTNLEGGITSAFERALKIASGSYSVGSHIASVTGLGFSYKLNNELRLEWARHCITALLSLSSLRNKEMNEKHDYRLLRPVKFKDLQVGDELILKNSSPVSKSSVTYKANKFVVLRFSDGSEGTCYQSRLEINYALAPLCWVEGKPVYPDDGPLYYKDDPAWRCNEEGMFALSICGVELYFHGGTAFPIDTVTWTKPEPKRVPSFQVEGQDVYPGDSVYYYGINKDNWGEEHKVEENEVNGRIVWKFTGSVTSVYSCEGGAGAFRLKPQLIIGEHLVPMPEREAPNVGSVYYTLNLLKEDLYQEHVWLNDVQDKRLLECGLVHLTKEATVAHGKAVIALSKKEK